MNFPSNTGLRDLGPRFSFNLSLIIDHWSLIIVKLSAYILICGAWISCGTRVDPDSQADKPKDNTAAGYVARELAMGKKPNRLIDEKSPYLLQHAFNPVDWYSWGEEAFSMARSEDKPIFLSIGYSTCHWCHVMEEESFENPGIAAIMNEHFISIKVDREERPDIDRIYMTATQAMTGGGGWPMSVFLTHDLKPFYTGTYFPPASLHGRPGFPEVLTAISRAWREERDKITESAEQLTGHIARLSSAPAASGELTRAVLDSAYQQFESTYDPQFGGFGSAPKFPRPVSFNFLLRYFVSENKDHALEMTLNTLRKMAAGGIYDHIGGGFHRYSVDGQWRVPHFEKMLYDQAQLTVSYLDAFQITNDPFFSEVAQGVLDYVLRDMVDSRGGFYSAEDADSPLPDNPGEKGEGAFYVWEQSELEALLGKEDVEVFAYCYGVESDGNALADPQREFVGKNILYAANELEDAAGRFGKKAAEVSKILLESRRKLFKVREERPRPHLDDKVLASWNGLMIGAFARGYQVLDQSRYLSAAERAAEFVRTELFDSETKLLLRRYRDGESGLEAHLNDYAFVVSGLLDLYEASLDIKWLRFAIQLTDTQIQLFWDEENGGFYDTSGKDASVLIRMKEDYDGAEPTGNSVAALNLFRLAQMTDNRDWPGKGVKTLSFFASRLRQIPSSLPQLLAAYDFWENQTKQIVIAGKPNSEDTRKMLDLVHKRYLPNKIVLLADGGTAQAYLADYLKFIEGVTMIDGKATAYICEDYVCRLPTSDLSVVAGLLDD